MDFLVTDFGNVKTLSRIVQCAAKVGDEVMFASTASSLSLRCLNASQSIYAEFSCLRPFFADVAVATPPPAVKVSTRALLPIFRAPHAIASVRLILSPRAERLVFVVKARSDVVKTFRVPVIDGRIGKSVFQKESCSCMLQTRPRFFLDILANFHVKLDEITFTPSQSAMRIASFTDDIANATNLMLRTDMTLDAREFEQHIFPKQHEVALTLFCKYFRAVLEFCDHFESPLCMSYEAAGHPVLFDLQVAMPGGLPSFKVSFVFATRHIDDASLSAPVSSSAPSQPHSLSAPRLPVPVAAPAPHVSNMGSSIAQPARKSVFDMAPLVPPETAAVESADAVKPSLSAHLRRPKTRRVDDDDSDDSDDNGEHAEYGDDDDDDEDDSQVVAGTPPPL